MTRKEKSLVLAGTVFSISTTIGQVISITNPWIVTAIAVPNALAWIFVAYNFLYIKYPRPSAPQYKSALNKLPTEAYVVHKHVETLPELMNIWQQDEIEYKEANVEFDLLRDWWEKNRKGLFIRFKGSEIQGSIGIWAISEEFFVDILNYNKTDSQLRARDIIAEQEEETSEYWYISGWFLRTNEDIVHTFLGRAFSSLLERLNGHEGPINISIMPMTTQETILLERLDFKKMSANKSHKLPAYCYTKNNLDHLKFVTASFLKSEDGIDAFEKIEGK